MKRKWIMILLALVAAFAFCGCGETAEPSKPETQEQEQKQEETEEAEGSVTEPEILVEETDEPTEDEIADLTDVGGADTEYTVYEFRNDKLLDQHYEKHGEEMGFASPEAYEEAACEVINNPEALTKTEEEDGDYVYYLEETNEFVIVSTDGYIRTYFCPSAGKAYFDRQ